MIETNEAASDRHSLRLSVAIPLYNEEEVIPELLRRLGAVLDTIAGGPHEIVLVDDGSRDATFEILARAASSDPRLVVVELSRNFGHQAAFTAALDHVTGDAVVLMDGDLQDRPEAIPLFVERFRDGYDVVYARRVRRKEGPLLRACYWAFYRMLAWMSNVRLPVDAGDFGLLSRRALDALRSTPERHRYVRGLRSWIGFRQVGLEVERDERAGGTSKYSARKLLRLAFDGIFAFSTVPLRAAAVIGAGAMALCAMYAVYAVVQRFASGRSPQGFTALIVVMTFLSGTILLFLGVIGEYVGRVYEEVKRRPPYVVQSVVSQRRRGAQQPAA